MLTRILTISLPAILLGAIIMCKPAGADVFTWVDKSGSINVSNLAPPDGVKVTNVVHTNPEAVAAREAAAREAARQAEVQALSERVRQLEGEVQFASMPAPPPVQYRPAPPPPIVQYVSDPTPPMQYAPYAPASSSYGCEGSQFDCGMWGGQGFYLPSVIVVRVPSFRRQPPFHDGRHMAVNQPAHQSMRMPRTMGRG